MYFWLLEESVAQAMRAAVEAGFTPTAEQTAQFTARAGILDGSRITAVAGDRAAISIRGVLTDSPDIFAMIFGGGNTTYGEIVAAAAAAEADPSIREIVFDVNSPGGQASAAWAAAMDAIAGLKKPTTATVSGQAASAAYGLASQASRIVAANRMSAVGSIGVAASFMVRPDVVEITSTAAPDKRPNLATDEGRAVVRRQLDAIHSQFAEAVARGRKTTVDSVNTNFGRGGMVLAQDAVDRGMIDAIAAPVLAVVSPKPAGKSGKNAVAEAAKMDLQTLKAQHPDLFALVVAMGVTQERDRVCAHLVMAEAGDAFDIAHKAIKDGVELTATVNAQYITAGIAKSQKVERKADEPAPLVLPNGGQPTAPAAKDAEFADKVASLVEASVGITSPAAAK